MLNKSFPHISQRTLFFAITTLILTGCEGLFEKEKEILPGTRESVLASEVTSTHSEDQANLAIEIPSAQNIPNWPQASGSPSHLVPPASLSLQSDTPLWTSSIGYGSDEDNRMLSSPIAYEGAVYAMDSSLAISAVDSKTGTILWQTKAAREDADKGRGLLGGGIAYDNGHIFMTSPLAEVVALDAKTGGILWRHTTNSPCRAAPTIKDGRIYVVTINNELEVYGVQDGQLLWTHSGITESAGVLGGANPAVDEGVVVVPYSSGEVFALRAENGHPLWSESLSSSRRIDSVATIAHIRARPIIDHGLVTLVSFSGRIMVLDGRTGQWLWTKNIGGQRTPAVAGNFIFMINNEGELLCLEKTTGTIAWMKSLPAYGDMETKKDPITWAGPIVVNDQLVVAGSQGQALFLSVKDGTITKTLTLPSPTLLSPIIADGTLYFLTDNAELVAFH